MINFTVTQECYNKIVNDIKDYIKVMRVQPETHNTDICVLDNVSLMINFSDKKCYLYIKSTKDVIDFPIEHLLYVRCH